MFFFTEQEFARKTQKNNKRSQIIFRERILERGPIFSKKFRNNAIEFCQKFAKNQIFCILVENEWSLTVWMDKEKNHYLKSSPIERVSNYLKTSQKTAPLIVCIDDCKTVQIQVKKTLELAGYKVLSIIDPVSDMRILSRYKPQLILMDINMPCLNGYQLSKILKKSRQLKDIPIAMFSSQNTIINRIRGRMCGAIGFLKKPVSGFELIDFVNCLVPIRSESILAIYRQKSEFVAPAIKK